jgi:hypothetical protein
VSDESDWDGRLGHPQVLRPRVPRTVDGWASAHPDEPLPAPFRAARERLERAALFLAQGDSVRRADAELRQALRDLGEDPPEAS